MSLDVDHTSGRLRPFGALAARFLRKLLSCATVGQISVRTPEGVVLEHQSGTPGPEAVLHLNRWSAVRRLVLGGDIAFAEAYFDGEWSTPDLAALLEFAVANMEQIDRTISGSWPARTVNRLRHLLRANSLSGSKRNIAYHYDLGNEFYRLWLDPSMTYSSALYRAPGETLEQAQENKLRRIAELLSPQPGQRVLEIGCGWGTLATRLATSGADVKGITLSSEQLAYARKSAEREGLADRVRIELEDYRDSAGSFDRIVSIEMIEAVGEQYWPAYFGKVRQLLADGGRAVIQAITIDESRYEQYRNGADFIQTHVFPGGMLPSKALIDQHARDAGLKLVGAEYFGQSYARTLAEWRHRFRQSWTAVEQLGFDQRFRRLWEYYLAYCEAGFKTRNIDVGLYVLEPRTD